MAQRFPDPADLESAAQYRPSVGANILNLLTGGIYGGLTGKTQRAQEGETARQLLLREQLQSRAEERDLERQMQRRLLETALTAGVDVPQGGDIYQRMSALRSGLAKAAVESEAGARAGYGFADIPTAEQQQSLPYQRAASEAQIGRYKDMSKANLEEEINRPRAKAQLDALGVKYDPNMPTAGLEALLSKEKSAISQDVNQQYVTDRNKEILLLAQSEMTSAKPGEEQPDWLRTVDVNNLTPAQINAYKDRLDDWKVKNKETSAQKIVKDADKYKDKIKEAIDGGDMELAEELVNSAPRQYGIHDSSYWLSKSLSRRPIPEKNKIMLDNLKDKMDDSVDLMKKIVQLSSLNKGKDINEISKMSFNKLSSQLDTVGAEYFGNDETRDLLRRIKQEFEGIVSKDRNTLFGASLTGTELASAKTIFGSGDSADFLPRAIDFMDRIFRRKPSERYPGYFGMERYDKDVKPSMDSYTSERAKLNWLPFQSLVPSNQPVTVTGAAPAATTPVRATNRISFDSSGNPK